MLRGSLSSSSVSYRWPKRTDERFLCVCVVRKQSRRFQCACRRRRGSGTSYVRSGLRGRRPRSAVSSTRSARTYGPPSVRKIVSGGQFRFFIQSFFPFLSVRSRLSCPVHPDVFFLKALLWDVRMVVCMFKTVTMDKVLSKPTNVPRQCSRHCSSGR